MAERVTVSSGDPMRASCHLLIAGTGRAGTTALVQLLDACGLDAGTDDLRYVEAARAGLERKFRAESSPRVVKHPYISEYLNDLIADGFDPGRIDAILVPIRDLQESAASRIDVFAQHGVPAPGGLWRERRPGRQIQILAEEEHRLFQTAAEHSIPVVLLAFPKFVDDAAYAWNQLKPVLPDVDLGTFSTHHAALMRPGMVSSHHYPGRWRMIGHDLRWAVLTQGDRLLRRAKQWRKIASSKMGARRG
jgi:hypothetical protein